MTRRYIARPRNWDGEWQNIPGPTPVTATVWERDTAPRNTGLLDHLGNELYAVEPMRPIGFLAAGDDP